MSWTTVSALIAAVALVACGVTPKAEVLNIRQLSLPVPVPDVSASNGSFKGLDLIGRGSDGRLDLNILLVHGIGWTQSSSNPLLGYDLVAALGSRYGAVAEPFKQSTHLCPQSQRKGKVETKATAGGLNLHTAQRHSFRSDDPQTPLNMWVVGCLDRTKIETKNGTITVYRLLWDDAFYDAFDYVLVGYDDQIQTGHEQPQLEYGGYEDLGALRRTGTRKIRDQVLTYGMTDAALYMGPVGELMRSAVLGAICTSINDAAGDSDDFKKLDESGRKSPYQDVEVESACSSSVGPKPVPFVIVAESLGSRMVFDVLSRERKAALARKLEAISGGELEVYLMANQIPLVAASRLTDFGASTSQSAPARTGMGIKYVAFTEVDDLLSYELVPYFEHLAYLRCRLADEKTRELQNPSCGAADPTEMARKFKGNDQRRRDLVSQLGFDVVDVRVKFAPRFTPITEDYADYQEAHTGYLRNDQVVRALVCGAKNGKVAASSMAVCRD